VGRLGFRSGFLAVLLSAGVGLAGLTCARRAATAGCGAEGRLREGIGGYWAEASADRAATSAKAARVEMGGGAGIEWKGSIPPLG